MGKASSNANMQEKRVAFVVGHENWGKSYTLRALFDICGRRGNCVTIDGIEFFVRKTSNDDIVKHPRSYIEFMNRLSKPYVIAALCPKFKTFAKPDNDLKLADDILQALRRKGYRLFFWVIEHKWDRPTEVINQNEISELRRHGGVGIFTGVNHEAQIRAAAFREFVSNIALA